MQYQALYRKYRPKNFSEVVGQEHIVETLINSIKNKSISHAYIFSGPRGTGKTTIAKIFARNVNCLKSSDGNSCGECESCLSILNNSNMDIIEMDAASNNSVDEIRDLRSKVNLVPSISKFKVYIIDEVHMLTTSAFNALLKTLEEPPQHVIFILATTELYKVPSTILSRCQCFEFGKVSVENMKKKLRQVADMEKIIVEDNVLLEISLYADGGMRDALSMLDKLSAYKKDSIDLDCFLKVNNLIANSDLEKLISSIISGNRKYIINCLTEYENNGLDIIRLTERLIYKIRDYITSSYVDDSNSNYEEDLLTNLAVILNECYNKMHYSVSPKIVLELELLLFMNKIHGKENFILPDTKNEKSIKEISKNTCKDILPVTKQMFEQANKETRINNAFAKADKDILSKIKTEWQLLFKEYILNDKYGAIACILIDAVPRVASNETLIVSVKYSSIIVNINSTLLNFEQFIELVTGKRTKIVIITEEEWENAKNDYIKNKKDGKEYVYIEEKENINIDNGVNHDKIEHVEDDNLSKIIDILGKEVIEME